ncbi:hypothetical protein TcCL_Unassigned01975 [Trypanosoma cruzi]|nr:hypothetical protein TcCL_Unassigned01975 [Trypanosoma cruzi]
MSPDRDTRIKIPWTTRAATPSTKHRVKKPQDLRKGGREEGSGSSQSGEAIKRLAGTFTSTRTPHPSGPGAQTEPPGKTRIKSAKQSRSESTGTPRQKQI